MGRLILQAVATGLLLTVAITLLAIRLHQLEEPVEDLPAAAATQEDALAFAKRHGYDPSLEMADPDIERPFRRAEVNTSRISTARFADNSPMAMPVISGVEHTAPTLDRAPVVD